MSRNPRHHSSASLATVTVSPAVPMPTHDDSTQLPAPASLAVAGTFNDTAAASRLRDHANHFDGQKFMLGLHCHWIKSQIPHGEFGPWLQKHMPELCRLKDDITPQPKKQLDEAMRFCAESAKKGGMTMADLLKNISKIQIPPKGGICHGGELLLLSNAELTSEEQALKEKLTKGIQLQLDFENGVKAERKADEPGKKLSPTELHAELIKTIEANFEAADGALDILENMKEVDFVLASPAIRLGLAARCKRITAKLNALKGKKKKGGAK